LKYYVTFMTKAGVIEEHSLDLNINDDIKWSDFAKLTAVEKLLKERSAVELLDITPEDMLLTTYTDETDDITLDEENE
jgi:hypothetical protein